MNVTSGGSYAVAVPIANQALPPGARLIFLTFTFGAFITAPLLTTGVNVNLPQTSRARSLPQHNTALTLTVERDGSVTLNAAKQEAAKLDMETLRARLTAVREANPKVRVYVRGDTDVPYGQMMAVMAEVTGAGITQVAFVTEPPKKPARSPR